MRLSLCVLLAVGLSCSCNGLRGARKLDLPPTMLWAWERQEDLGFLTEQQKQTGVAFLAATGVIAADGAIQYRMRTQGLTMPPHVPVLAVVRIESPLAHATPDMAALLAGLETVAHLPDVRGLQIDFDARLSERAFYRSLLRSVWKRTDKPIGITALASWCDGDRWMDGEPVAEAVPMFFRMGRGETHDMKLRSGLCRSSIGLSTDEAWPAQRPRGLERIYLFSPQPWTQSQYTHAMQRIEGWK